jgi:transcriptional regulator with XRE-family HTH domain
MNNRIYEAMIANGLNAYELAKKAHIDKGALSRYLSGKVQPKSKNLHALAVALNVSETWLMGYDVDMQRETEEEQKIGQETLQQEMSRRMLEMMIDFYKKMTLEQQVAVFERVMKEEQKK